MSKNHTQHFSQESKFMIPVFGIVFVVIGVLFLLGTFMPAITIRKLWPLFIMIPVLIMSVEWIQHKEKASGVIFPIILLTIYTAFFLWLNYTTWTNVRITWPTFLLAPGVAFVGLYITTKKWGVLIPGSILLALAAIFYSVTLHATYIVAILLITGGVLLIVVPRINKNKNED